MAQLAEHPTVKQFREREAAGNQLARPQTLDSTWLRQVCLEAGAGDVGFVEAGRPEIADQQSDILAVFSSTKTLVSFVLRMNRENIDRKSTRLNSSHLVISYAVFCLKKKIN